MLGTSNKTELLLGYGTLYGDMASAVNPLGDLYKTQVWALSRAGRRAGRDGATSRPSADLWVGQTDEAELGFAYREVDRLLYVMVDLRYGRDELIAAGFAPDLRRRGVAHGAALAVQAPPAGDRQGVATARSTATSATRATGGSDPRAGHDLRRGDADRQPRRHHPARAARAARGGRDRRRGHAPHARPARAPRDPRAPGLLSRPRRGGAGRRAGAPRRRRRERRAGERRRHAADRRSGLPAAARGERGRGARRPGAGRVGADRAAVVRRAADRPLHLRGLPAAAPRSRAAARSPSSSSGRRRWCSSSRRIAWRRRSPTWPRSSGRATP